MKTDFGQAEHIRSVLLNWDAPGGPKRIAAETFAKVDTNHDGRIQWQNEEILTFIRLVFHYHHVNVPPWSDFVWYELYRLCEPDSSSSGVLDQRASARFARGCLEAALRCLQD